MLYELTHNQEFNSIEIKFASKPDEATRDALKALRFRWHSVKKIWYGYADEETVRAALDGNPAPAQAEKKTDKPAAPAEKKNKFGVKVGDIFHASWGYDQTNNDFFQVVSLCGESSVRVREVNPPMISSRATGPDAEDRVFQTGDLPILPPVSSSVFVKDQERGDIKRLKRWDETCAPRFTLASYADATLCTGDTIKVYESWYA